MWIGFCQYFCLSSSHDFGLFLGAKGKYLFSAQGAHFPQMQPASTLTHLYKIETLHSFQHRTRLLSTFKLRKAFKLSLNLIETCFHPIQVILGQKLKQFAILHLEKGTFFKIESFVIHAQQCLPCSTKPNKLQKRVNFTFPTVVKGNRESIWKFRVVKLRAMQS